MDAFNPFTGLKAFCCLKAALDLPSLWSGSPRAHSSMEPLLVFLQIASFTSLAPLSLSLSTITHLFPAFLGVILRQKEQKNSEFRERAERFQNVSKSRTSIICLMIAERAQRFLLWILWIYRSPLRDAEKDAWNNLKLPRDLGNIFFWRSIS